MKPQPLRTPSKLSDSVHHQLSMYALAASAAGVGVLALSQPADAKIVYTKTHEEMRHRGDVINIGLNHDGTDFSLLIVHRGDSNIGMELVVCPSSSICIFGSGSGGNGVYATSHGLAAAFKAGVRIGPKQHRAGPLKGNFDGIIMEKGCLSTSMSSACLRSGTFGNWANVRNRYLGLSITIRGKVHYGWARLNVSNNPMRATLTGYAYETVPNKPIITGKTKGPDVITVQRDSLGHLAAGASAIPAWRTGR